MDFLYFFDTKYEIHNTKAENILKNVLSILFLGSHSLTKTVGKLNGFWKIGQNHCTLVYIVGH